jgi:hypothetical protein
VSKSADPGRLGLGGDHDLVGEDDTRRLDGRELELLLRAEVSEQAALAHSDGVGEPCDREARESLDGGELRRLVEDRVSAPLAVAAALPLASIHHLAHPP